MERDGQGLFKLPGSEASSRTIAEFNSRFTLHVRHKKYLDSIEVFLTVKKHTTHKEASNPESPKYLKHCARKAMRLKKHVHPDRVPLK